MIWLSGMRSPSIGVEITTSLPNSRSHSMTLWIEGKPPSANLAASSRARLSGEGPRHIADQRAEPDQAFVLGTIFLPLHGLSHGRQADRQRDNLDRQHGLELPRQTGVHRRNAIGV